MLFTQYILVSIVSQRESSNLILVSYSCDAWVYSSQRYLPCKSEPLHLYGWFLGCRTFILVFHIKRSPFSRFSLLCLNYDQLLSWIYLLPQCQLTVIHPARASQKLSSALIGIVSSLFEPTLMNPSRSKPLYHDWGLRCTTNCLETIRRETEETVTGIYNYHYLRTTIRGG